MYWFGIENPTPEEAFEIIERRDKIRIRWLMACAAAIPIGMIIAAFIK